MNGSVELLLISIESSFVNLGSKFAGVKRLPLRPTLP